MKALAVTFAVIMASIVSAHAVTTNQQTFSYFTDAGGGGKGTPGAKVKKAQSALSFDQSLAPSTLRRLQRLMGEKPTQ
jgi:opacity protein-like surface antigen